MTKLNSDIHENLTTAVLELLYAKQIFTVLDFVNSEPHQISKITNLCFRDVIIIRKHLLNKYSARECNAFILYKNFIRQSAIVPSGIKSLDRVLEGGFYTGNVYEICGTSSSGKTQLCLKIAENTACKMEQNIYYLDTKNDFSIHRLKKLFSNCDKEQLSSALKRIFVKQISTKYDLINALHEIRNNFEKDISAKVIVIDSLPSLFLDCTDQSENNGYLNHIANIIHFIAVEFYVVFIVTNLITTWNDGDFKNLKQAKEIICCGKYWYTVPNTRLKTQRISDNDNKVTVTILKSNVVPDNSSIVLSITDNDILPA